MYVVGDTRCLVCRLVVAILALYLDLDHCLLFLVAADFVTFVVRLELVA